MRKINAVLFDMDGLMFDTERLASRFWIQAGAEKDLEIGEEFLSCIRGSSKERAKSEFSRCYGESHDYQAIRNRKTALLREYLDSHDVPVKKGLRELLSYLKSNAYKTAVATSTEEKYALRYLESAGVRQYFDGYVCGNMVKKCKPDPEIFYKAAELIGCRPEECVVLEDSLNGNRAAIDGGFIAVMIPDISKPSKELERELAGKLDNLLEVIDFLEEG